MYFRAQKKWQGDVSLNDTIEGEGDGDELFLGDVVGQEDTMLSDLQSKEDAIRIRHLVDTCLTEREADVIRQRYGLNGFLPHTQKQVASQYGISRSYISRIEKKALEKLEAAFRAGSQDI